MAEEENEKEGKFMEEANDISDFRRLKKQSRSE